MDKPEPFIHVSKEGKDFQMVDCEFIDHGSNRPFIKTEAEGTQLIRPKITYTAKRVVTAVRNHPVRAVMIAILVSVAGTVLGLLIEYHFFVRPPLI